MGYYLTDLIDKEMLPGQVEVYNMAISGDHVNMHFETPWNKPYSHRKNYEHVLHSQADAILSNFGSNDIRDEVWNGTDTFIQDNVIQGK